MKGHIHVYKKKHINTDEIIPARYLNTDEEKELAKHAMEDIDTEFINNVKPGDFIVAGEDFGCGSSREHAIWALRSAGIKAVIADSFARIFYRNCINNALPAIECPDLYKNVKSGDELEIDLENGIIKNLTDNKEYKFTPMSDFALELMKKGGLLKSIQNI